MYKHSVNEERCKRGWHCLSRSLRTRGHLRPRAGMPTLCRDPARRAALVSEALVPLYSRCVYPNHDLFRNCYPTSAYIAPDRHISSLNKRAGLWGSLGEREDVLLRNLVSGPPPAESAIRKDAGLCCGSRLREGRSVCLCWALSKPKGPKGAAVSSPGMIANACGDVCVHVACECFQHARSFLTLHCCRGNQLLLWFTLVDGGLP